MEHGLGESDLPAAEACAPALSLPSVTLSGSAGPLWAKLSISNGFGKKTDQLGRYLAGSAAAVPLSGSVT